MREERGKEGQGEFASLALGGIDAPGLVSRLGLHFIEFMNYISWLI